MRPTVYTGAFVTMDPDRPAAQALLVGRDGRIEAVGDLDDVLGTAAPGTPQEALPGWVLPGLVEPHGHPLLAALMLGGSTLDVRPVVVPDADGVLDLIRSALAGRPDQVFANGWDPLLQRGLPVPDRRWLDDLAGQVPLVILHNSGHAAYFNSAAAALAGIDRNTPDPPGARFTRDDDGELDGAALEAAALGQVLGPVLQSSTADAPRLVADHLAHLNALGYTTVADLSWDPANAALLDALRGQGRLTVRLRTYEGSSATGTTRAVHGAGDALVRQVGIKTWSDGSPWVGNIATSFPYLDTPATRSIGLEPGHRGTANYSTDQLVEIGERYVPQGWQLACHAHGDLAIAATLDAYETLIARHRLTDHRFRLEHVGAMTPALFERAAALGVTVSLFVDHLYYWGDVLVDDLFGPEHGGAWADAGAAFAAGHRATFHNDGTVTPYEAFRNMSVASTRRSRSGRSMPGGSPVSREDALAAHTSNAAWQLFSEHEVGALRPGLLADLVAVDRDPRSVSPDDLAETQVLATHLAGEQVWGA